MQQESLFSTQLKRYITMAMQIWPSLKVGLRHISDITTVQQHSLLPRHTYNVMNQQQFLNTLITDMHQFIMEHDVKEEDIEDYLNDILDLLSIEEDSSLGNSGMGTVRYMSQQVIQVITELQDGKMQTVDKFQTNIYNPVIQMGAGQAIRQGGDDSSEEEEMGEEEGGSEDDSDEWDEEEMEEDEQKEKDEVDEEKRKQQQELEDDGWVVVKKKK